MASRLSNIPKFFHLGAVAVFRGKDAVNAATRRYQGYYPEPPWLSPGYEPRPLRGFVRLRDTDEERFEAPCPLDAAVEAAVADRDWRALAALFADTLGQWERRSHALVLMAESSLKDQTWLADWERAEPEGFAPLLVRAERTMRFAWQLRGASRARYLTQGQRSGFTEQMAAAEAHMHAAVAADPLDPTGKERMLRVARSRGWPHRRTEALWKGFTALHPHGFEGHLSMLQYKCAKWFGSDDEARAFAAEAASAAPQGSFLNVLPLVAAFEEHYIPSGREYRTPQVEAAVDACLAELAACPDAYPRTVIQVRHVLAYVLNLLGRHREAVEQFRAVDGHVGALPWSYFPNTVQEYGWYRRDSVRRSRR
ncbi:hypothetical protein [Glycomyces paridis]|uniref:DUF4034 domain-containing protein n=1 Tax=Glycomyces paridis TaxID=2126555 RepID=A0A4S8PNA2_9ACTN|nr:hypothetical protein [Glycomyces paridis]THV31295.1 hypothetical protein E9998_02685 [Glycomyces paridis]